ncbi:hypothetical protein HMPREF0322_04352 [Desulfitobacterium hafniense DP7]|uniref:Uncharacterized protein n=1 Tax=Desulfitobacterium hafniense DP7 TaxID=537010 RepID=G9XTP5_DESHA|nr:hypothetical protein HMPREF0322_04352 [Desulfitobacterium hafniense DP7]
MSKSQKEYRKRYSFLAINCYNETTLKLPGGEKVGPQQCSDQNPLCDIIGRYFGGFAAYECSLDLDDSAKAS